MSDRMSERISEAVLVQPYLPFYFETSRYPCQRHFAFLSLSHLCRRLTDLFYGYLCVPITSEYKHFSLSLSVSPRIR